MNNLATIIGKNIAGLRKKKGLTQQELAERVNYSDKSISKWELGYAAPSIDILIDIASFFGVTVDYLLKEQSEESIADTINSEEKKEDEARVSANKAVLLAMSMTFVLLVALSIYFSEHLFQGGVNWLKNLVIFLWMIPAGSAIAALEIHRFYHNRVAVIVLLSLFIWSLLIAFCVQFGFVNENPEQIWFILGVGVPLQVILILATQIRFKK